MVVDDLDYLRLVDARDRLSKLVVVGQDNLLPLVGMVDELGGLDAELGKDELGLGGQRAQANRLVVVVAVELVLEICQHGCGHDRVVIRVAMPHDKDFSH